MSHEDKDPVNLVHHIIPSSWLSIWYLGSTQKLAKYVLSQQESWHLDYSLTFSPFTLCDLAVADSLEREAGVRINEHDIYWGWKRRKAIGVG